MASKSSLLAAAFSAHLGIEVKSENDARQLAGQKPGQVELVGINMSALFSHSHDVIKPEGIHTVKIFGQERDEHQVGPNQLVSDIKTSLASKVGIRASCQQLICRGKHLRDDLTLAQQNVFPGSMMSMAWRPQRGGADHNQSKQPDPAFYIKDDDLDPQYDYDFTNRTDDGRTFDRGGYLYYRPYGWDRAALKVLGRYSDGDVWLGECRIRTDSSSGEWAVSYHGTAAENVGSIADGGYNTDLRKRQIRGPGIYSTPSLKVASDYAAGFTFQGKQYKMILQNRVNLKRSTVIPSEKTGAGEAYFVTPNDDDIRPYGVCIKTA